MPDPYLLDPYAGNILTAGLGPLRSRPELVKCLTELPPIPKNFDGVPPHVLLHYLMAVRNFHLPGLEEFRLHETIELMVRPNYQALDPTKAQTWAIVSGENSRPKRPWPPSFAAAVVGISGTGKSEAILRCLNSYPQQVINHTSFPQLQGNHQQVVWLSLDVPASGRAVDLARALMLAWHRATGGTRFSIPLSKQHLDGMRTLAEWQQVATAHFLGILHLDEVQNFFKLPSLKKRTKRAGMSDAPELSIVEDQALRWILTLINTWHIPLLVSGTPDGIGAFTRRLSNTERIVTSGYHAFHPFESSTDPAFIQFLQQLGRYQYVRKKIAIDEPLAGLIFELTGGIQRVIIALWIAAQRLAIERSEGDLRLENFKRAAATFLAPVAPAIAALRSKDPVKMSKYEDLMPREDQFWSQFWNSVSRI